MILPHSPASGLEDLLIAPPVLGEYDRGMKAFPAVMLGGRRFLVRKVEIRMCKFYSIDCKGEVESEKLLSEKEFVFLYSNEYYLKHGCKIKNLRRSSCWVEKQISSILKNGIQCELDVVHIMAWKIGKINHAESEKKKKFCYTSDWKNAENFDVKLYGEPFDLKKLVTYIVQNVERLQTEAITCPLSVVKELSGLKIKRLGPVYIFTLLYFLSKGKYPIYDRFAHVALNVIVSKAAPGTKIYARDLTKEFDSSKRIENVFDQYINHYVCKLKKVFNCAYKVDRNIDRALWSYGHIFYRSK